MSKRSLNSYADFDDWFFENLDPYKVRGLQKLGIKSLVGSPCYSYATDDMFEAWGEEIVRIATQKCPYNDIREIVKKYGARSKSRVKNVLVWLAVENQAKCTDVSDYTFDEDDWGGEEAKGDSHEA